MYDVSTSDNKKSRINVKISPTLRAEFHLVAKLRGDTVSGLIHRFIVKTIREEKLKEPEAFTGLEVDPPLIRVPVGQANLSNKTKSNLKGSRKIR